MTTETQRTERLHRQEAYADFFVQSRPVMSQTYVQTFQCPKCREYINVSAKQCRFCGSAVDTREAAADAQLQTTVAQAVNLARAARVLAWSMLAFWANAVIFYIIGTETGVFIFLPFVILLSSAGAVYGWWSRYGKLQTSDVDYVKARNSMKTTVVLMALLFVIPLLLLLIAWSTGVLSTMREMIR